MTITVVSLALALVVLLLLLRILRRGRVREKYAALWLLVSLAIVLLAVWPGLLTALAQALGFQVGSNLLFFLAIILLLAVSLHLSLEVSGLEDENRVLAEEVSLLWAEVHALGGGGANPPSQPRLGAPTPEELGRPERGGAPRAVEPPAAADAPRPEEGHRAQ